ncbi:MAG: ABC transporter, partial [Comamonadaceae bacterium]|nr:ABC transporter [Comamonadaceae bacterium]
MTAVSPPPAAPQPPLAAHENVLCALDVDLSQELRFAPGRVALTDQALYSWQQGQAQYQRWPASGTLDPRHTLQLHEHAGLLTLSLHTPEQRLAHWHLSQQGSIQAQRLVEHFKAQVQGDAQSAQR